VFLGDTQGAIGSLWKAHTINPSSHPADVLKSWQKSLSEPLIRKRNPRIFLAK